MADETRRVILSDDGEAPPSCVPDAPSQTRRVAEIDTSGTMRVPEDDTAVTAPAPLLPGGQRPPLGTLMPGRVLCGDCTVVQTLQPHESQRPGLYLCSAPEGQVIVKVAATTFPPKLELWERLVYLLHPHVLRTYRTLEDEGFFFEVQEYCTDGTMESRVPKPGSDRPPVSPEWITHIFIPQVAAALKYLHEQEIIHRDIKPANIYRKTLAGFETLVLGDFDISSVLEQSRTSRDTQRTAGTWYYTAPEAFPRFVDDSASGRRGRITRSSDYYSLGITLIELLLGTTSLHLCQLPDLFDFYLQGGRVEIPQGIPGRLTLLLRGLLIRNRQSRWGAAEVERWLHDNTSENDLKAIHDDEYYELARASRPYRLKSYFAVDLPSLAEAMFHECELATEDLITGDVLLNWIGNLDPTIAREIRRDRDQWYLTPEVVLLCAILRCDPTRPFVFSDGAEALTPVEWIKHAVDMANRSMIRKESFNTTTLLAQLTVWLRLKTNPQPELAERVEKIQQSPEEIQLEELIYLLIPNKPYEIMRGVTARTPREIVQQTYGAPNDWKRGTPHCYEAAYKRWLEGGLCAWLRQRKLETLAAQCDEIREKLDEEPGATFETILRLLEPTMPPVVVEMDLTALQPRALVHYGTQRTFALPYTTRACGIPFGALKLEARSGLRLNEQRINMREGVIELTIDAETDIPVFRILNGALKFEGGGFTQLHNAPLRFQYQVTYSTDIVVRRMLIGAGIGAGLMGLPRLILSLLGMNKLAEWPHDLNELAVAPQHWSFPYWAVVMAFCVLVACIYVGLRVWLKAFRESER